MEKKEEKIKKYTMGEIFSANERVYENLLEATELMNKCVKCLEFGPHYSSNVLKLNERLEALTISLKNYTTFITATATLTEDSNEDSKV